MDESALGQLESHANQADPRERCFLYAQLLAGLTELEGRQIAAGEDARARVTMRHMNDVAAKIQAASQANAKKLKDTEQVLERVTHRVHDMVRAVSSEEQAGMQSTFQHLSTVHSQVLAMVFAR